MEHFLEKYLEGTQRDAIRMEIDVLVTIASTSERKQHTIF
jgi:hypothetical protein